MDGIERPCGRKPLKTYSKKDIRPVPPEKKATEALHDELTTEHGRSIPRLAPAQSLERDRERNEGYVSSKKRRREGFTTATGTPKASSSRKIAKQTSIKKRILAEQRPPPLASEDDAWIYASPIHSSIEVCARDQPHGQRDDIEPTPVPSIHSSGRKIRAPRQRCKKIRILTLRQQLALPALEESAVPARGRRRRLKKSKTSNVIQSTIPRKGIQEGGDGFLSSELLPPSAKKRRLNGRPKANSFYLSESRGLELAKGPLPSVRFLSVFELEHEREGGGMLQLARPKSVAFDPNIRTRSDVDGELDSTIADYTTRESASSSSDDIYLGASTGQETSDEISIEEHPPGVIRRLGRSTKGLTPMPEKTEAVTSRKLSENLFAAVAQDRLLVDIDHDLLFADSQSEAEDAERVTQLVDDENPIDDDDRTRSSQQSDIVQEPRAGVNAVGHVSPHSSRSSASQSSTSRSPTPSSSPPQPGQGTSHLPHACKLNKAPVQHHLNLDSSPNPPNPRLTSNQKRHSTLSKYSVTNNGDKCTPLIDPSRSTTITTTSPFLLARSPDHQARQPSNKTILFDDNDDDEDSGRDDDNDDDDNDNKDICKDKKAEEETYFDLLLEREASEASWSGLSDYSSRSLYSSQSRARNEQMVLDERSRTRNDNDAMAVPDMRALQIPRSIMVMETSPHLRTGRGGAVQVPRTSLVVESSPRSRRAGGDGSKVDERHQITGSERRQVAVASPGYGGRVVVDLFSSLRQIYDAGVRGSTVSLH